MKAFGSVVRGQWGPVRYMSLMTGPLPDIARSLTSLFLSVHIFVQCFLCSVPHWGRTLFFLDFAVGGPIHFCLR